MPEANRTDDAIVFKHPDGYTVIIHPETPGNELYLNYGRPCPRCKAFCLTSHDFNLHQKVCEDRLWRESGYKDGSEICPADKHPELTHACQVNKKIRNGLYEYSLSQNSKWLKRKHI